MDGQDDLRRRIEVLEAQVAELQAAMQRLQGQRQSLPAATRLEPAVFMEPEPPPPVKADWLQDWQAGLNRLGIGLFLLGIGFLFLYGVDQGWFTPQLLLGLGLLVGAALLGLGIRLSQRLLLSQYLQGGGLATFYITGFAAYQVLQLVPFSVAFGLMVAVTVVAFGLALGQNRPAFAYVGITGGLATPFVLYQEPGSPLALGLYTLLLMLTSLGIYVRKGWQGFVLTSFGLGWLILLVAAGTTGSRWGMQGIVGVAGLSYAGLPLLRGRGLEGDGIALANPGLVLLASWLLWDWGAEQGGWAALGLGAIILVGSRLLPRPWESLWLLTGQILGILGTALVIGIRGEGMVLIPLAAQGWLLHRLGIHYGSALMSGVGHGFWGLLAMVSGVAALALPSEPPLLNGLTLGLGAVIAGAAACAYHLPAWKSLYGWGAYIGSLLWLQREAGSLTSLGWAGAGMALIALGRQRDRQDWRRGGLITIGVTVLRLLLLDLALVDPIWRVLLLVLVGGGLLSLSYILRDPS
ncbi:MAG: DUF2339 domain-containing protein [Thermostichales cyanobacterium BF4_bins_65]